MERLIAVVKNLLECGDFYLSSIELDRGDIDVDGKALEAELRQALAEAEAEINKTVTSTVTSD